MAEDSEIDFRNAMFFGAESFCDLGSSIQFNSVALSVVKRKAMAFKALILRDCKAGCGVQTSAQETNGSGMRGALHVPESGSSSRQPLRALRSQYRVQSKPRSDLSRCCSASWEQKHLNRARHALYARLMGQPFLNAHAFASAAGRVKQNVDPAPS